MLGRWVGPSRRKSAVVWLLSLASLSFGVDALGRQPGWPASVPSAVVALADLPPEALVVHRKIHADGVFRHDKDGAVFGNREGSLPWRPRGFYREYTVPTPGARDRGARRLVCGGPLRLPEVCYYTADHYASFRRVLVGP